MPKVALVTGGSSGIGQATCVEFAKLGCHVVIADVDEAGARETEQQIAAAVGNDSQASEGTPQSLFIRTDVTKEEDVKHLIQQIRETYGRLDYCMDNAGIESEASAPTADCSTEDFDKVMAVNVRGVFLCLKYQIPFMLETAEGQGAIVITSSIAGVTGIAGCSGYVASKHAVVGLMRSAAAEYGPKGLRINCINPGAVDTPLLRRFADTMPEGREAILNALAAGYPLGRISTTREIAEAAVWLCTKATFMTGQTMVLDGGGSCST